jgi:DNA-binding response OmpR family regulator
MNDLEAFIISSSPTLDLAAPAHSTNIFVVCDQDDTAPVWGYMLRQQGLNVVIERSVEKVIERWSTEMTDLVVLDVDVEHEERMDLYRKFRAVSVAPILLFLPRYHETEILEAYHAGGRKSWPGCDAAGPYPPTI